MFARAMALVDKETPLVTVTQTADGDPPERAASAPEPDVIELKERDHKRYEFIAEHGRGGLGRVMRTRDKDLGREVAVKEILNPGGIAEARFVREAMITARLEHPGIVPVHDAGRWPDGTPFYSMKLVSGRPLKSLILASATMEARLAILPNVMALADAMAYAHDRNIVHRDLKPSNVIVGDFGETIVIDWGLAKDLSNAEDVDSALASDASVGGDITVHGAVIGTPAFMPPEQGMGLPVDKRCDVYSIGAILYNILAGVPPFSGSTSAEVLRQLLTACPRPLKAQDPQLPDELCAIAEKAMQPRPAARYSDAAALAADLRRFLNGHLVTAYEYSTRALIGRWLRRHRGLMLALATGILAAGVATGLSMAKIVAAKNIAFRRSQQLQQANNVIEDKAGRLALAKARAELQVDPATAVRSLAANESIRSRPSETLGLARQAARAGLPSWSYHFSDIPAALFSPSGNLIAAADGNSVSFIESASGALLSSVRTTVPSGIAGNNIVVGLSWLDDHSVALARLGGGLWIVTRERAQFIRTDCAQVRAFRASPTGLLYVGCGDGLIKRIAPATAEVITLPTKHSKGVMSIEVLPDGLASVSRDGVLIRSVGSNQRAVRLRMDGIPVKVRAARSGLLAIGSSLGEVVLVESDLSQHLVRRHPPTRILDLVFLNDTEKLVSTSVDGMGIVGTGEKTDRVLSDAWSFGTSPDGRIWVTGSESGVMTIMDSESSWMRHIRAHADSVSDIELSPNGSILTTSDNGELRLWPQTLYPLGTFTLHHAVSSIVETNVSLVVHGTSQEGTQVEDTLPSSTGLSDPSVVGKIEHGWKELDATVPIFLRLPFASVFMFRKQAILLKQAFTTALGDLNFAPVALDYSSPTESVAFGFLEREVQVFDAEGCVLIFPTQGMANIVRLVRNGRQLVAFDDSGRGSLWRLDNSSCVPLRPSALTAWINRMGSQYSMHL